MTKKSILAALIIFLPIISGCSLTTEKSRNNDTNADNNDYPKTISSTSTEKITADETENLFPSGIISHKPGDLISSPVLIEGKTHAIKNSLIVELRDSEHRPKVSAYAIIVENASGQNDFKSRINFLFQNTAEGYIAVYEKNGEEIKNLLEIPIKYNLQK
jgi:PBP1b-binding outer membrane lipoprotein LpoB